MSELDLGPVGMALTVSDTYLQQAAELERLGYSALWLPGGQIDDLNRLTEIIGATTAVPVASAGFRGASCLRDGSLRLHSVEPAR